MPSAEAERVDSQIDSQVYVRPSHAGKEMALILIDADQGSGGKGRCGVLRSELSLLHLMSPSKILGISASYPSGNRDMITYCRETAGVTRMFSAVGALAPLYMNMREIGLLNDDVTLLRIGETLRKRDEKRTDLEDRLVRALAWFGKSTLHPDQRETIMDAFIGMEALLLQKFEVAKRETIAERSAFPIADAGEERLKVYRLVARLCDVRNDVAHSGLLAVSQNDVEEAIYILRFLVLCSVENLD